MFKLPFKTAGTPKRLLSEIIPELEDFGLGELTA